MKFAPVLGMPTKRVVLQHASGLHQIMGYLSTDDPSDLPARLHDIDFGTHTGIADHAKTTDRYVLYREFQAGKLGVLNEFNPVQR